MLQQHLMWLVLLLLPPPPLLLLLLLLLLLMYICPHLRASGMSHLQDSTAGQHSRINDHAGK
jgi:H+/Cl- antiporter ClcA